MIWKQFINQILRWLLLILFGAIASKEIISPGLAEQLATDGANYAALLILALAPILLKWIAARFDKKLLTNAYWANPAKETLDDVKSRTVKESRIIINSNKSIFTLVIVALLCFSLTGCPKKESIRTAAEASYRLPGLTNDAIDATRSAFEKKLITLEQKDRLANVFLKLAKSEKAFAGMVDLAVKEYDQTKTSNPEKMAKLAAFFRAELLNPFFELLAEFKALPSSASAYLNLAVDSIRLVLLTISNGLNVRDQGLNKL